MGLKADWIVKAVQVLFFSLFMEVKATMIMSRRCVGS